MPPDDDVDLSGVETLDPDSVNGAIGDPTDAEDLSDDSADAPDDSEGDEGGDDDGDESDALDASDRQPDQQQQRQPGRGSRRIQELNRRLREERVAREATERRIDELIRSRGTGQAPQQTSGETEAQRAERRSRLTPEERISEDLKESEKRTQSMLGNLQFTNWDTSDRSLYETKASIDPLYRRWQGRVEKEVQEMRGRGQNASREAVFFYLIGKAMSEQRDKKGGGKRKREAQQRVERNTTRPGGMAARSDAGASRGRERGAGGNRANLAKRLENTPL